jgi:pimeloyl-ACP methyl ester carboxylesterase
VDLLLPGDHPGLAKRFTVIAVELPGQGYTTLKRHSFGYDLEAMSGALESFMDAVGLPRASVVGHFWDGAVSLDFPTYHDGIRAMASPCQPVAEAEGS